MTKLSGWLRHWGKKRIVTPGTVIVTELLIINYGRLLKNCLCMSEACIKAHRI